MTEAEKIRAAIPIGIMDAIYKRRAVRDYTPEAIDRATIEVLLYAATQAPTAMHEEPWAFAIIQDKALLDRLSEDAKQLLVEESQNPDSRLAKHGLGVFSDPTFHVFYNASTLIIIYGKPMGQFVSADCWLAAENLLLAAYATGLGSCVIGFAVAALNTSEWKRTLNIPDDYAAYAPIIIGKPAGVTAPSPRKPPDILVWK